MKILSNSLRFKYVNEYVTIYTLYMKKLLLLLAVIVTSLTSFGFVAEVTNNGNMGAGSLRQAIMDSGAERILTAENVGTGPGATSVYNHLLPFFHEVY